MNFLVANLDVEDAPPPPDGSRRTVAACGGCGRRVTWVSHDTRYDPRPVLCGGCAAQQLQHRDD